VPRIEIGYRGVEIGYRGVPPGLAAVPVSVVGSSCAPGNPEGTRNLARRAARNAKNAPVTSHIFE
jgi:hypothetical protein